MPTDSAYTWDGLTLTHRTSLTGSDLTPQWALVRVRRALEEDRGEASGRPSDGTLEFDDSVSSISLTGAYLPNMVSGEVRAESVPGGVAVIATASLMPLLMGLIVSVAGVTLFFAWHGIAFTTLYWIFLSIVPLAAAWHLRQITRVLRMVTTAGTSL